MKKIFKFPIEPKETVQTINLPQGAEVVSLKCQLIIAQPESEKAAIDIRKNQLFLWAIVDPVAPAVPRRFMCVGTGWEIQPDIKEYIDSVLTDNGFVWHLLEIK